MVVPVVVSVGVEVVPEPVVFVAVVAAKEYVSYC